MPTRGRNKFASLAIEQFTKQDYWPCELVIIDDEDQPSFPHATFPLNVFYYRNRVRMTIAAKRNIAIARASGSIIAHWDDDDWSSPGRLTEQFRQLRECGKDGVVLRSMLFTDGQRWWRYRGESVGTSLFYKRILWQNKAFQSDQIIGEDNWFVRAAGSRLQAFDDDLNLMVARIHRQNTSNKVAGLHRKQWEQLSAAPLEIPWP